MLIMFTYIFPIKKKKKYIYMTRTCKKSLSRLKTKCTLQIICRFNSVLKYFYTSDMRRYVPFHFFYEKYCSRKNQVIKSDFIFGILINVHQSRLISSLLHYLENIILFTNWRNISRDLNTFWQ